LTTAGIDPFFEELGWNVANKKGYTEGPRGCLFKRKCLKEYDRIGKIINEDLSGRLVG
jgi:hypothetical protein